MTDPEPKPSFAARLTEFSLNRRIAVLVLFVTTLVVGASFFLRDNEPTYEGKKLSEWLDDLRPIPFESAEFSQDRIQKAREAVLAIGADAVPCLLQWMEHEDSNLKIKIASIVSQGSPEMLSGSFLKDFKYHSRAQLGFEVLGYRAADAVPRLEELMKIYGSRTEMESSPIYFVKRALDSITRSIIANLSDNNAVFPVVTNTSHD